jgi:hypothetical protein
VFSLCVAKMGKSAKAHKRISKAERLSKKQQAEAMKEGAKQRSTPKGGVPKAGLAPVRFWGALAPSIGKKLCIAGV